MSELHNTPEFDDILTNCLHELLRDEMPLELVLANHPEHAAELKPLLQVALLTTRLKRYEMSPETVDDIERHLLLDMPTGEMNGFEDSNVIPLMPDTLDVRKPRRTPNRLPLGLSRLAAVILVALLLAVGSGGGLVAASANTVPGDTLYSVKRAWESLMLLLAQLLGQGDDARSRVAYARLMESQVLDERGHLSQNALVDLYRAIYELSLHRNADNNGAILLFMRQLQETLQQMTPAADAQPVYTDLVDLAAATVDTGVVQIPDSPLPPSLSGETPALATATPAAESTPLVVPTQTLEVSATQTLVPTITQTPSATFTVTPRIPATATKTPTVTPSITPSPTLTLTPSATWTPLPLPGLPTNSGAQPTPAQEFIPSETPRPPVFDLTPRPRETQQSVYLTQTALATLTP